MTTAAFLATTTADKIEPLWWLSIEGLRVRYGGPGVPSWSPADSGTNQPVYDYLMRIPKFEGQSVEPMNGSCTPHGFEVELLDDADYLTGLFAIHDSSTAEAWVTTAIAAADVSIVVDDSSVFSNNTDAYIDRETVRITAIPDATHITVTRGMYGSEAVAHALTDSQGNTRQVGVTDAPTFITGRRCWLREGRVGLLEVDHIEFPAIIDHLAEDQGVWTIKANGFLSELGKNLGAEAVTTTLIRDLWGAYDVEGRIVNTPDSGKTFWFLGVADASLFPTSGVVKVDSEIIEYENTATNQLITDNGKATFGINAMIGTTKGRGMFLADIMGQAAWEAAQHVVDGRHYFPPPGMAEHEATAEVRLCLTHKAFVKDCGDYPSPISVLRSILVSSGTALHHGSYDVLPATFGCNIDNTLLDATSFTKYHEDLATYGLKFCIPKPIEAKEWLEKNILRPFLLFLKETPAGLIGIGELMTLYDATHWSGSIITITEDDLLSIPKFDPGSIPIGEFEWKVNYSPGEDEYYGTIKAVMGDANEVYRSRAVKFGPLECSIFYDPALNKTTTIVRGGQNNGAAGILNHYIGTVWDRFACRPVPRVTFEISYGRLAEFQIGDPIILTCSVTPSMRTGARGLTNEYFQIVKIQPKPESSVVEITAWQIGAHDSTYRAIAPAGQVLDYNAVGGVGGRPRVTFDDAGLQQYGQDLSNGFVAGDKITFFTDSVVPLDGLSEEVLEIYGVGTDYIDLTAVPTTAPVATNVCVPASYSNQTTTQKTKWATKADANGLLGAANDAAHVRA